MCGSYIHGRSWKSKAGDWWKHFCEPYTVNAHCEMPTLTIRESLLVPYEAAKAVRSAMDQKGAFPLVSITTMDTMPDFISSYKDGPAIQDLEYKVHTIDLSEVECIDFTRNLKSQDRMDFFIIMNKPVKILIDWGLRPWDGTLAIQCSKVASILSVDDTLKIESFLPKTRTDLTRWARAHWGKRDDSGEFIREMPRCLDFKKLKPDISAFLTPGIIELIKEEGTEVGFPHLTQSVANASDPCGRWADMFAHAPNAFWAERN